jgi:biopolymer transport protein ExbB/TolQ
MVGRMFDLNRLETAIPVAISSMFFWAILICNRRWRRLRALERISRRDLLLRAVEVLQSSKDLKALANDLKEEVCQASPLLRRLQAVVQQWMIHPSLQNADLVLQQHVANDEEGVHAGYSLVRTFVWALPVLGLIGTVLGISDAVGGFAQFLGGGIEDVSIIKKNLVSVTGGLSFAFLITLHGLLTSLVTMLVVSALQTREEKLYATIQQGIADTFLPALQEVAPESQPDKDAGALATWRDTLQQTTTSMLETIHKAITRLLEDMDARRKAHQQQIAGELLAWHKAFQQAADGVVTTVSNASTRLLEDMNTRQEAQRQQLAGELVTWRDSIQHTTAGILETIREAGMQLLEDMNAGQETQRAQAAEWTQAWRGELEAGAGRLREALSDVGDNLMHAGRDFLAQLLKVQEALGQVQTTLVIQSQTTAQQHTETLATIAEQTSVIQATSDTLTALTDTTNRALQHQVTLQEAIRQLHEANLDHLLTSCVEALSIQAREIHTAAETVKQLTALTGDVLSSQTTLQEAIHQLRETGFEQTLNAFRDGVQALSTQVQEIHTAAETVKQLTTLTGEALSAQVPLQEAIDQLRETGFEQTLAGFRDSLVALGPILDGFQKPFVLQAIPVSSNTRQEG